MNFTKKYLVSLSIVVLMVVIGRLILGNSSTAGASDFSSSPTQGASLPPTTEPSKISTSPNLSTPSNSTTSNFSSGKYKNGTYTGSVEDASYGNVQVKITIANGKITNVAVLQYPNDNGTSARINTRAIPRLQSEVIQAQSANINAVSGASFTSQAFYQSLNSALTQAS